MVAPAMKHRGRALCLCAALGLAFRLARPTPAERTLDGLAAMLGAAVSGTVSTDAIAWEPSPGVLSEIFSGRRVIFLATGAAGEPRDLYRARVRLTLEGRPVSVEDVHDLTSTPFGDERSLVISGERAAYATASFGKVQSITVLDLRASPDARAGTMLDRAMAAITNAQETGSSSGIGRVEITLDEPAEQAKLAFAPGQLVATIDGRPLALDLATSSLVGDPNALGARAMTIPVLRKRPILWAVDTVRAEVGPEPIAWLEEKVFDAKDEVRRVGYGLFGAGAVATTSESALPPSAPLDASAAGDDGSFWPPPRVPSIWKGGDAKEGAWEPVAYPFLKRLPRFPGAPEAPPYFFRTTIHPDPQRPYAKVIVVAMDMRQLELDMEGGVEDPKPLTGAHGLGKIPRDPKILGRVVAAFNGAFKTTHGAYGMMVHDRVLLPPKPDAATVVVTKDMRVGLGTWGASTDIPGDLLSFRQNLEPLVEDGKLSPSGRTQWGWQLAGTSMFTERTGLCLTRAGHLFYLWGDEVSATTLGRAMLQVGCTYGMHLDMNPHHTGFVFAAVRDATGKDHDAKLLTSQMEILPERYLEWSPKDFFYVMLRDPAPDSSVAFTPDVGAQPAPAWLPGVWRAIAQVPVSAMAADGTPIDAATVQVEIVAFDAGRVDWRVRAGVKELARGPKPPLAELSPDESHRVIAAIGLGNGKDPRPLGLATDGQVNVPLRGGEALLVVDPSHSMRIVATAELAGTIPEHADVAQLPLVVEGGRLLASARDRGSMHRRGALCVTTAGRALVATATSDSDEATAKALLDAGCTRVVALDRGSHHQAFVHRTGGASPPNARYEQTVLFAVGHPMTPRAFRWDGGGAAAATEPAVRIERTGGVGQR